MVALQPASWHKVPWKEMAFPKRLGLVEEELNYGFLVLCVCAPNHDSIKPRNVQVSFLKNTLFCYRLFH